MNADTKKKTIITSLILTATVSLLILLAIKPISLQIRKESLGFVSQKKELLESEARIKNIHDFKSNIKQYQSNIEKISGLLADASEPIEFIEFLEKEADNSSLTINISPPVLKEKKGDFWPLLEFSLETEGSAQNFLKFLDRLESAPYIMEITNLTLRKNPDKVGIVSSLSLKVYTK